MADQPKTCQELTEEIAFLNERIQELEEAKAELDIAQNTLQESTAKYQLLADTMTDIVWIQDLSLRTLYVSPSVEKMLGFTPEERMVQDVAEQLTPESLAIASDVLARELDREQQDRMDPDRTIRLELEYWHKDGSTRWVESIINGIRNDQGELTGIHGVSRDITERKKAEDALKASEEKFRHLFERAGEGILIVRGEIIEFVNPALERILGHSMERLTSEPFVNFIHPDDRGRVLDRHLRRMGGETVEAGYDFRVVASDGTVKWVAINSQVISWEGAQANLSFVTDITDGKRAEEALRQSEELLKTMMEQSPFSIEIYDPEGFQVFVNRAYGELWGIPAHVTVNKFNVLKSKEMERLGLLRYIKRAYAGEVVTIRGYEFDSANIPETSTVGRSLRLNTTIYPLKDPLGRVMNIIVSHEDITDRERAEEALRESEEKYRTLVETATESIFIAQDGMIKFCNKSFSDVSGYEMEALTTMPFTDLIHPEDQQMVFDRYIQRVAGKDVPSRYSFRFVDARGNTRWADINVALISWEGKPASLCFAADITDRRHAEEALRKSEEKFRHLFEKAEEGMLVTRGEILEFVNPALERMLGHPMERITSEPFITFIHPDDQEMLLDCHTRRMRGESVETGYDFRIIASDGTVKWVTIRSQVIDWEGEPANLGFVIDITDRRRAEEEKLDLERRLAQAQKLESIGTLAGGIAHDFNNLLMGIQGNASLALMDLDPSHPHYERLRLIEKHVASGADLTKQLLGFAQGGRYDVKPLSMNEIVRKSSAMFGRTRKELSIHEKYAPDPCIVEVDRSQMEQVLMNLFVNACEAMPGGGAIFIETEVVVLDDGYMIPSAVAPRRYMKLTFTDTGMGMDEQTKERIFDPFFTTKGMGRGTGLGLPSVYGIIKGHGGMITVDSEPGQGTTFTLYMPASGKDPIGEKKATEEVLRGTETILLVDDEKMILDVSREMLESLGYRIFAAGSGQEGLAVYAEKKDQIALVILDMIMPGISGSATFDQLREINPDVKVLLASGYAINGPAQKIMDRGCDGFIQKPFGLEQISQRVRELLD